MPRKLTNWIDGFERYTQGKGSPDIWRRWAAIFCIGAAVERKVWVRTAKGQLYPNMYVVLVGAAGTGKSLATNTVFDFLSELQSDQKFHIAPVSTTKASLIDKLDAAQRRHISLSPDVINETFNSLTVIPNELGVFLPAYDSEFMSTLTDLWDCKRYSETRRTHKISINIDKVQLSMFTATTPSHLNGFLPDGAWEQGFMSRVIPVFSTEGEYIDLFKEFDHDEKLHDALLADLRDINGWWGEMKLDEGFKEAFRDWDQKRRGTAPTHPKLQHYNTRRPAHLLKLCLVAAVSDNSRVITIDHFTEAFDWLTEAETFMPDIFKAMKTGGDARVIEECYHFVYESYIRSKAPIQEHRLIHFLQERTPVHNVARMIEIMERAQFIKKQFTDGGYGYLPQTRRPD